jgi:hypothetical protein
MKVNLEQLFKRIATDCDLDPYTVSYCTNRLRAEGAKFLTVTLPKLAKSVLTSIEAGYFIRPTDFAWQGRSLRIFRSLLHKIFCRKTGYLVEFPCAESLAKIRQICEYCYKLALEFDQTLLDEYEANYEATQKAGFTSSYDYTYFEQIRKFAETHYSFLFKLSPSDILSSGPRSGPGAIATGAYDGQLPFYEWKLLPDERIGTADLKMRPYSGYFKPYPSSPTPIRLVEDSRTAEVLFVPKDSRGPRVISKEPAHLIRAQMAFFSSITQLLERKSKYRNNFRDQTINQGLAREGSLSGDFATLDMKEASDRVRYRAIRQIFRNAPGIRWMLQNTRSTHAKLPSGRTIKISSLAGMGSGFTFSLLGFFIKLCVEHAVCTTERLPYKEVASRIYIYGDDLIVPSAWYHISTSGLARAGMVINHTKSFYRGPFRESCGKDYLNGIECTPTRLKLAGSRPKVSGLTMSFDNLEIAIVQVNAHCRELRKNGMFHAAEYLEKVLETQVPMPYVGVDSPVIGRVTSDENLIRSQCFSRDGSSYVSVKRYACSAPVMHTSRLVCSYKYLSSKLRKLGSLDPFGIDSQVATKFGDIPIPRRVKIQYRKEIPLSALLGTLAL